MIPCTDFIPAYSELFKYIEGRAGKDGVGEYWAYISDNYVKGRLGRLASEKGIVGCWEYWHRALNEEAADFSMSVDEGAGRLTIEMRRCPSKGLLLESGHIEPYHDYCGHCDLLYRRALEPLGFAYSIDLSETHRAACKITVEDTRARGERVTPHI